MTLALASIVGAWVASFSAADGDGITRMESLQVYGDYFIALAVVTMVIGAVIAFCVPKLNNLMSTDNAPQAQVDAEAEAVPA